MALVDGRPRGCFGFSVIGKLPQLIAIQPLFLFNRLKPDKVYVLLLADKGRANAPQYHIHVGGVDEQMSKGFMDIIAKDMAIGARQVHLALSTPVGDIGTAITLHNALRAAPFELTTYNLGRVDSAGIIVFLAGKQRYASQHATFLFHDVTVDVAAPAKLTELQLRAHLDDLTANRLRIRQLLRAETRLSDNEIDELLSRQRTVDARWARDKSLITAIREFVEAKGNT